ncbi:hypothetical protein [Brachybacterium kimchii]|uniref:Lipoprotein n=1 Tax=Brachybacterium kimchii TaxID=2942909 RepID=A0ABY4NB44_9MICO|nr:hypothetical protein [Brachybacterium kimchii]UQN31768.1 hypothetical protein M4486_19455 [Brachybacterium kimchii]
MIRQRALTAIAVATLAALPLAACDNSGGDEPTASTTTQDAPATADPADATPQERVQAYMDASDAAAAKGWKDSGYADEYLVPDLAKQQKADDAKRADTGAIITGDRKVTDWTVTDESDTAATIEFCEDSSGTKATKDGKPYKINNQLGEYVGQYKLTRDSSSDPWMIQQKGYYEEGTSCAKHFAD